ILELRVFKLPFFVNVTFITIITFTLLISAETIVPMYVQKAQQYSALQSGLIVMPGALTLSVMSLLAGRLFDKYGGKILMLTGFILLACSTLAYYVVLDVDTALLFTLVTF